MLLLESSKYLVPVFGFSTEYKWTLVGWWSNLSNSFIVGDSLELDKIIKIETAKRFTTLFPHERVAYLKKVGEIYEIRAQNFYNDRYDDRYGMDQLELKKLEKTNKILHRETSILIKDKSVRACY